MFFFTLQTIASTSVITTHNNMSLSQPKESENSKKQYNKNRRKRFPKDTTDTI